MYQALLGDAKFHQLLLAFDRDLAAGGASRRRPSHTTWHTGHVPRRFDRVELQHVRPGFRVLSPPRPVRPFGRSPFLRCQSYLPLPIVRAFVRRFRLGLSVAPPFGLECLTSLADSTAYYALC